VLLGLSLGQFSNIRMLRIASYTISFGEAISASVKLSALSGRLESMVSLGISSVRGVTIAPTVLTSVGASSNVTCATGSVVAWA
jgi:hypothetical protein